ncbi:hypothetical protein RGQ29_016490 [Quercus rubra]|uniref:Wax synthase domain-containing protein n=1 Tax=Quercus rubra TaxID=3512 RepID=A0AAN7IWI5_QUERU|nr:hypothetical protein RGQ29_016490 [Quercus rubra]
MEGEINNFIKVWFSVLVCLSYCYAISKIVSKGPSRLLCVLPIVCIFLFLPFSLHTIDLGGTTAFFIAWLANFKLLMFAFGKGPLCSDPSISLGHLLLLLAFPIEKPKNTKNKSNPSPPISHLNGQNKENITSKQTKEGYISLLNYAIKCILMVIMFRVYDYGDQIHPKLILILYCFHIYFSLEIILAIVATLAQALVGLELEPQFNEPYLSTSLQDFWGRRWNLMVTSIVRVTVYNPTLSSMTRVVGHKWALLLAVFTTFVVSGLMHELIFYYMGRLRPTWEIMCFFLLHGFCLVVEIVLKKSFFTTGGRWRLPCLISGR